MRKLARATATAALTVAAIAIPLTGTAMASTTAAAPSGSYRVLHPTHGDHDRCDNDRHYRGTHYWNRYDDDCRSRWDRDNYRDRYNYRYNYRYSSWNHRGHDDYRNCYRHF
ncbi:hypothetical protein ACFC18_38895 [Streptomyces sp. NPDC056121]|uniref:hypothetical protein n=1 Tax=unclassified Streptomyces TaxID=2593676 RepID=UPI0035DBCCB1